MGFAKYFEDNKKLRSERLEPGSSFYVSKIKPTYNFKCPYCNQVFFNNDGLHRHIKNKHNIVNSIVTINKKIASLNNYVRNLESIEVTIYSKEVSVYIDEEKIELKNENTLDITSMVQSLLDVNHKVKIIVGSNEYNIKVFSSESINMKKVNSIIQTWSQEVALGKHISKDKVLNLNEVEDRYLSGFFNYFIACISKDVYKHKRYEDAFSILSEFCTLTTVSKLVVKVIALRFNWVGYLDHLCDTNDIFRNVCDFYFDKLTINCQSEFQGSCSIFIEDEIEDYMNAIVSYQKKENSKVDNYLYRNSNKEFNDSNHKDRVYLLRARRNMDLGKLDVAYSYFEDLTSVFFVNYYKSIQEISKKGKN